jgi:hypothetical protein
VLPTGRDGLHGRQGRPAELDAGVRLAGWFGFVVEKEKRSMAG